MAAIAASFVVSATFFSVTLPDHAEAAVGPPNVVATWVENVGQREAVIAAQINPQGSTTTYHIQWGPSVSYGEVTATETVGSDEAVHLVSQPLNGLAPGETYHWRVVAVNEIGTTESEDHFLRTFPLVSGHTPCPNELFRIGPSGDLPDCRAYEMVSPVDKNGGDIRALGQAANDPNLFTAYKQGSDDGDRITYTSGSAFGDAVAGPYANQYISARGEEGWGTHGVSPLRGTAIFEGKPDIPSEVDLENPFQAFTPDLCSAWLLDSNLVPLTEDALHGYVNLYRRQNCGEEGYEALSLGSHGGPYGAFDLYLTGVGLEFGGASLDLEHQVFMAGAELLSSGADEVGSSVDCTTTTLAEAISYQWLRNGVPIPGATTATYTIVPEDAGTAIQCQVFASSVGGGSTQASNPPRVVAPATQAALPRAPGEILAPSTTADLKVGLAGGQTLTCDPGPGWMGSPTFTYQWYRNGVAISGANASTYEVTAGDLSSKAGFQCAVTGSNSAGAVTEVSLSRTTKPKPSEPPTPANASVWPFQSRLYDLHQGDLEPVGILPNGEPNPENSVLGSLGSINGNRTAQLDHAISTDGSRIFWTSTSGHQPSSAVGPGQIYVRVNGEDTLPVSEEAETLSAAKASRYWTAAADGSRVLFTALTGFNSEFDSPADLYEFDVDKAIGGEAASTLIAHKVLGVVGASDDLSRVYFVSLEALGDGAIEGDRNLFLYEKGKVALVAVLSANDVFISRTPVDPASPIHPFPVKHSARVTPDGGVAVFQATARLTGYDNLDPITGKRYTEVYRYDAASDELTCVSCNPTRAKPTGLQYVPLPYTTREQPSKIPKFKAETAASALLPTCERQLYCSRAVSDDGNRVFFHSYERLIPADTNGVKDVYQWEAAGSGSCEPGRSDFFAEANGCIDLISTGTSSQLSEFYDASSDGSDVFIATTSDIDPRDEGLIDVYDARIEGGFPRPGSPPECVGDACQSISSPPTDQTPASAAFNGPEDPRQPGNCRAQARRAARLARKARRTGSKRLSARAHRLARRAARCRRAASQRGGK